jgi:probable HAF family extracellular repeat protein
LGALGGGDSAAFGINRSGQVIGEAGVPSNSTHAFRWENGIMTDLGTLDGDQGSSFVGGINDAGDVVGYASAPSSPSYHAFLYDSAGMHDLTAINKNVGDASGINDQGQMTGGFNVSGQSHAYLWSLPRTTSVQPATQLFHDLGGLPGYPNGGGLGINTTGQVYGTFATANFPYARHSFFVSDGVLRDIGTLGGDQNYAYGMNDRGYVVGTTQAGGGAYHAYVWHDGNMVDLGIYGLFASVAHGINNLGQVVGTGGPNFDPFIWQDGVITDLATLIDPQSGWNGQWLIPTAINDAGLIVGYGTNPSGEQHAFLLTPDGPSTAHAPLRLDPLTAQRLAAPSSLAPAILEITFSGTGQPTNLMQPGGAETSVKEAAPTAASTVPPPASAGHQTADAAFVDLGTEESGSLLASPLE